MLGSSASYDFLLCAGLGVSAISALLVTFQFAELLEKAGLNALVTKLCLTLLAAVMLGAQYALAVFIGETKTVRNENSALGYAVGGLIVGAAFFLLRKIKSK